MWKEIHSTKRPPSLFKPILIVGLPGIGNVGKIAADFIIDGTKARKLLDIFSPLLPAAVYVSEHNLVELPRIELYYKKYHKGSSRARDVILLTGDAQPEDEPGIYALCEKILALAKGYGVEEIITLGGIALQETPENPCVFCTGNGADIVAKYTKGTAMNTAIYGVVGPILGTSGLLLGLAGQIDRPACVLLAETGSQSIGISSAYELVSVLNKKCSLKMDLKRIRREIDELESVLTGESSTSKSVARRLKKTLSSDTSYIG